MRSSICSPNLMQRRRRASRRDVLLFCRALPVADKRRHPRPRPLPVFTLRSPESPLILRA